MAPITMVFRPTLTQIDSLTVDATMTATHTLEAETTDYPVDSGGDVTDGINVKAPTFKMEGLINSLIGGEDRSFDAYQALADIIQGGQSIQVVTQYKTYNDVVMTSLEVRQDKQFGGTIPFSATFKAIRYAEAGTVAVIKDPNSKIRKKMGPKTGKDATDQAQKKTWAKTTGDAFGIFQKTASQVAASAAAP